MRRFRKELGAALLAVAPFLWAWPDELETAQSALQDHLYPIARQHAEKAVEILASSDPVRAADALQVLLQALSLQGRPDDMLRALDAHAALIRSAPAPQAFAYWRAQALLASGRSVEAAQTADQGAAQPSAFTDALRRIGARARLASGDTVGALALFVAVDKTATNVLTRSDNALEWAEALDRLGRAEESLLVLKTQADLNAACLSADEGALLRGRILMRMGKPSEATKIFTRLALNDRTAESPRVQAWVELSVYAFDGGRTNEAIASARSAFERAQQPETRRLAGFRLGDLLASDAATIGEAEKLVKSLVREYPEAKDSMCAQLKLADSFLQARRPEQAASEYRIFLETYPASILDAQVLQGRGWALFQLGRYTEACGVFLRASELATNDETRAECRFKQGDSLLADGRYVEAARVYEKLAEDSPKSDYGDRALFQSADCLERAGLRDEAVARYRKVAELCAGRDLAPQALLRLASLQTAAAKYEEAIKTYASLVSPSVQKAVRIEAWLGRGKVHYRMFRFDAAMQDFAAVSESDSNRRDEARFFLVLCLYGLGRDKEARAAGASFVLDFPESARLPDMVLWLGKFDFNHGQFADAQKFFLEYVTRWPASGWSDAALLWASRAASRETDFTKAVELVTRLIREYPQSRRLSEARLVQAEALMELARFDEAVLLLDQVLAQAQDSDWYNGALLRKGDCLFALGSNNGARYKEALYAYRELVLQENLPPTQTLQLHYKIARCLEKLKRVDEAIDEYYSEVMIRYQNERTHGVWHDETSASFYVRAAFNVSELYEQKGLSDQSIRVLQRVIQAGVPGEDEARQRIERLKRKK